MLNEYKTHSTLNPKLWDGDRLKQGLTEKFIRTAKAFYDFLEVPENVRILDILLIGSNANYNWTKSSDIDLHVVIDYQAVDSNLHLVKNYMMAKKSIWNNNYPLKYKGMDVELYAQDWNARLHSSVGQYSVMRDKWIKKPSAETVSIDDEMIEAKAAPIEYEIKKLKESDPHIEHKIKDILQRLYKMRQTGLEAEGEYSVENLAFKKLRSHGLIARIKELNDTIKFSQLQFEQALHEGYAPNVAESLAAHMLKQSMLDDAGWQNIIKHSGGVEDAQGQWSHPGRCTMIPSSNITMHNVPHRVLGIDDTGHSIMMHPEQTYSYPGARVFEIPVTPQQHTLLIQLRNAIQNGARYAK